MDRLLNTVRSLLTGTVLLAVAAYAASRPSCDGGTNSATAFVRMIRERERLEQDRALLHQRAGSDRDVIDPLIAGQLSLREAAAALREEDERRPQRLRLPAFKHFLHLSQEERYMRQLLLRVEKALDGDPRQDEVLRRLHEEFERESAPSGD